MHMQHEVVRGSPEGVGKREVGQLEPSRFQPARLGHAEDKSLETVGEH